MNLLLFFAGQFIYQVMVEPIFVLSGLTLVFTLMVLGAMALKNAVR
jgi:hypothetical protein